MLLFPIYQTGAGWGGCTVALTDSISKCDSYITALKKSYYSHIPHAKNLDLDEVVFATVSRTSLVVSLMSVNSEYLLSSCPHSGATKWCRNLHSRILLKYKLLRLFPNINYKIYNIDFKTLSELYETDKKRNLQKFDAPFE